MPEIIHINMYTAKNLDIKTETVKEFLKQKPNKLPKSEQDAWYYLYNKKKEYEKKIKDYFWKCISILGYDTSFIGFKDTKTGKRLSFYSPYYVKNQREKYNIIKKPSRFSSADKYSNFKHKIMTEQDNYGFRQKNESNVLWLDLDCHDDSLLEEYVKIRDLLSGLSQYSLIEHKNNGKGTHMWILFDTYMTQEARKELRNKFVKLVHLMLNIPLEICFTIIDAPKAWFRIPWTQDYKSNPDLTYIELYEEIQKKTPLPLKIVNDNLDKKLSPNTGATSDNMTQSVKKEQVCNEPKTTNNNIALSDVSDEYKDEEVKKIIRKGLSRGNSYRELGIFVTWLVKMVHKHNVTDIPITVDSFVNIIKKLGNGKGTAEILSNEEELRSRIKYFLGDTPWQPSSKFIEFPKNWRDSLTKEQQDIEKSVLTEFITQNKLCERYHITIENIRQIVDFFLEKYLCVKPPFRFNNLCGNFSAKYIIEGLELPPRTYGISSKIQGICSNLYGFRKIIDKDGRYWVPGTISCRYVFVENNEILIGNGIFKQIGENMLKCKERLQCVEMKHVTELLAVVPSIHDENVTYIEVIDSEATKEYYRKKRETIKNMNPKGRRKTKAELQQEAEDRAFEEATKNFRLGY